MLSSAALALAVGCTEYRVDDPISVVDAESAPTVTISDTSAVVEVTDEDGTYEVNSYSFKAVVTAPEGTAYYSYLIVEGEGSAEDVNATSLLKLGYDGLAEGTVCFDSENPSTEIELDGLDPDMVVTIYAVLSNTQGSVSEVSVATCSLKNLESPYLDDYYYSSAAGVMLLIYSEPVTLSGDVSITATVRSSYLDSVMDTITIEAEDMSMYDEYTVMVTLPETYASSSVFLTWDEGLAYNSADVDTPAQAKGVAYTVPAVNFDLYVGVKLEDGSIEKLTEEDDEDGTSYYVSSTETVYFSDDSDVVRLYTDGIEIYGYEADATCIFYESGKTTYYDLTGGSDFGAIGPDYTTIVAYFPADLSYGATAEITFEEGAFVDAYGNLSNAISTGDIYYRSRDLDVDDIAGTYNLKGVSYWDELGEYNSNGVVTDEESTVTIAVTTSGKGANASTVVTIEGLFYGESVALTTTFNEHSGVLAIPHLQDTDCDYNYQGDDYDIYFANANDESDIEFTLQDDGSFTCDHWWGYYISGLGWFDVYMYSTLTPTVASPASALSTKIENILDRAPRTYDGGVKR